MSAVTIIAAPRLQQSHLVTAAYTLEQRASRSFAAELLAPREALKMRVGSSASQQDVNALTEEFQVSRLVIQNQLQNAQVRLDAE